jgi:cell division protein FtsB
MKKELTITGLISIIAAVAPLLWWVSQNFHSYDQAVEKAQLNYEATQELISKVAKLEEEIADLQLREGRKPMSRPRQEQMPAWKEGK